MKKVLSVVVTALVAVSFAGLVCAAEHSPTDKVPADAQSPDTMKSNAASSKKSTKKHKKGKKAATGTTDMGSTPANTPTTGAPAGSAPGTLLANQ